MSATYREGGARISISEVAERHLDKWLDQLMRGEISLAELPLAVTAFYQVGFTDAIKDAQAQLAETDYQLDRMYLALMNPKDRVTELQRRLEDHFQAECDRFFAEPFIEGPALKEAA